MQTNWFVLQGQELYTYKNSKLTNLACLTGVFVKSEKEEKVGNQTLYPFVLSFPNKRRVYYLDCPEKRDLWVKHIKLALNFQSIDSKYSLLGQIGKGKYGIVKEAINKLTKDKVAVKIVSKKDLLSFKEHRIQIRREIDILKMCKHPNVVSFVDVFETEETLYIVMSHIDGSDLFHYLSSKNFKIPESTAQSISSEICKGMTYLHSLGVAHRDIKPENVLISK